MNTDMMAAMCIHKDQWGKRHTHTQTRTNTHIHFLIRKTAVPLKKYLNLVLNVWDKFGCQAPLVQL